MWVLGRGGSTDSKGHSSMASVTVEIWCRGSLFNSLITSVWLPWNTYTIHTTPVTSASDNIRLHCKPCYLECIVVRWPPKSIFDVWIQVLPGEFQVCSNLQVSVPQMLSINDAFVSQDLWLIKDQLWFAPNQQQVPTQSKSNNLEQFYSDTRGPCTAMPALIKVDEIRTK